MVYTFYMRKEQRGQHLIEYALIATIVLFGIMIMGPYVLRSINAHFKMWDDQIQDSHNERFITPSAVPDTPPPDNPPPDPG